MIKAILWKPGFDFFIKFQNGIGESERGTKYNYCDRLSGAKNTQCYFIFFIFCWLLLRANAPSLSLSPPYLYSYIRGRSADLLSTVL